jgi:hypothetical protein
VLITGVSTSVRRSFAKSAAMSVDGDSTTARAILLLWVPTSGLQISRGMRDNHDGYLELVDARLVQWNLGIVGGEGERFRNPRIRERDSIVHGESSVR